MPSQLGEVWPEDWSLAKDRSYGITARLGTGFFAPLGARIYVFGGMRRLEADFKTSYTGCLLLTACLPDEFTNGRERHDEDYDAWIAGVGVEKNFGSSFHAAFATCCHESGIPNNARDTCQADHISDEPSLAQCNSTVQQWVSFVFSPSSLKRT